MNNGILTAFAVALFACGAHAKTVDFSVDGAGNPLTAANNPISGSTFDGLGITDIQLTSTGRRDTLGIFDSTCSDGCTGGDYDLQTGVYGSEDYGNLLIVNENYVDPTNADDAISAAILSFTFEDGFGVTSMTFIDIDSGENFSELANALSDTLPAGFTAVAFDGIPNADITFTILSSGKDNQKVHDNSVVRFDFAAPITGSFDVIYARGTSVGIGELHLAAVPVPATLPLALGGALALGWVARRRPAR